MHGVYIRSSSGSGLVIIVTSVRYDGYEHMLAARARAQAWEE
jgi:hypothetical protein